ncbi:MAG: Gfo/Idh/MocA family protein [Acetobacteraceae bacterium]
MPAATPPPVAVIGAGAIGRTHANLMRGGEICRLSAIADPTRAGREFARSLGVRCFADHLALIAAGPPQAAIIATPNDTHVPLARDFIRHGIPVLVEKPIASDLAEAEALCEQAERAQVALMVGHHRRHNPIIRAAREAIASGRIGRLTMGAVLATFLKPRSYFDLRWHREPGGGPVLINLIHEIDLIRFIGGEIVSVQAATSNARRHFPVEDSAAVILSLEAGALITVSLSDTVASPWSWDLSAGENPAWPKLPHAVATHFFCGTEGALSLPGLELWEYGDQPGWMAPIACRPLAVAPANPYLEQLKHLVRVIDGKEAPLSSGADATRTLAATLAVHQAARTQRIITLS